MNKIDIFKKKSCETEQATKSYCLEKQPYNSNDFVVRNYSHCNIMIKTKYWFGCNNKLINSNAC